MNEKNINSFGITSDKTLEQLCRELDITLNFIGFDHELLSEAVPFKDGGYIINIGDTTGTHWVCFNVLDDKVFYFDSFAVPPGNDLITYFSVVGVEMLYWNNVEQFQQLNEELCGLWCIVGLWYLQKRPGTMPARFLEMSYDI